MRSIDCSTCNNKIPSKLPLVSHLHDTLSIVMNALAVLLIVTIVASSLALIEKSMGIKAAHAAEAQFGFNAAMVSSTGSGTIVMKPGEVRDFTVGFQNTGDRIWSNEGDKYVSIYTYGPKYRKSVFDPATWVWGDHPALISERYVEPGKVAHVNFQLRAPQTLGTYTETFNLGAEDTVWIPGGKFSFTIKVTNDDNSQTPSPAPTELDPVSPGSSTSSAESTSSADGVSAMLLIRSANRVVAKGGESVRYTVGIKNTGSTTWTSHAVKTPQVALAFDSADSYHSSWESTTTLASASGVSVAPGALELIDFSFTAPRHVGNYKLRYTFTANENVIPGMFIDIPVAVTSDAGEVYNNPVVNPPTSTEENSDYPLIEQPLLRVGFLIVDEETDWEVVVSCETAWKLTDGDGKILGAMKPDETVRAFYKNGVYNYNLGTGLKQTPSYLRFVPDIPNKICKVNNFDRRVTRNFTHPDNTFRNVLELRYNSSKDRTWMINELPIEYYLRGLAETSNISPLEYQKALVTVARTYALYHYERGTKHGDEFYHISSYSWDQVYNGYGQEMRAPKITQAVEATRGRVVTYDNKTAITPYFSRSDGRTRDWSEVWHGSVAWLKSVPAPCDAEKGRTLWGHGVGLSASEALCMANRGSEWIDILTHFYQGVELNKHWE